MLRITSYNESGITTFKLEGKLTGEWVNVLRSYWRRVILTMNGNALRIDLAGLTWLDEDGRGLLGEMHRDGAELLAPSLLMAGVVAEISDESHHS
jgi:anti-anti-sigma regulatory factor